MEIGVVFSLFLIFLDLREPSLSLLILFVCRSLSRSKESRHPLDLLLRDGTRGSSLSDLLPLCPRVFD